MKNFILILALIFSASLYTHAQDNEVSPPAGNALVGDSYGAGVSEAVEQGYLTISELSTQLAEVDSIESVVVAGTVTEVCKKKGCWMRIETENNEKFFVRMKDYGFFVPTSLEGKTVLLNGKAEYKVVSVEEQKHYLEDGGKSPEEIAEITEPEVEIRFLAEGIRVIE